MCASGDQVPPPTQRYRTGGTGSPHKLLGVIASRMPPRDAHDLIPGVSDYDVMWQGDFANVLEVMTFKIGAVLWIFLCGLNW